MERKKCLMKVLVIGAICLLILPSLQGAFAETSSSEPNNSDEKNSSDTKTPETYTNCIVLIFGNCNLVGGALTWIFGLYIPLFKKHIWINAGGESLSAVILGGGFGFYYSIENLIINMWGTNGILFWGGKSLLVNNKNIIGICKADTCTVIS